MAFRLEGGNQLNEIIFQDDVDSFPLRDNFEKVTSGVAAHALSIESLESGGSPPASSSAEVITAREEAADLVTRIKDSQDHQGWGIFPSVLNELLVSESGTPDDKVVVDTGQGMVNGSLFRETSTQTLDPADFSLGITDPRIDVVHISANGTAAVTTGTPAATPLAEQIPANTIEIARLWLEPSGGNPNVPNPIKDFNDGTNSYIRVKLDRFLQARKVSHPRRIPFNQVRNGSFAVLDNTGVIWDWTATNTTIAQNADAVFENSSMKITNDGTNSAHFASTSVAIVPHLRGQWLTVAFWIKMTSPASGDISCAVKIKQTGDSPEQDVTVTARINSNIWQRVIAQAYIDNETTAIDIEIYPDGVAVQVSTTAALVDGVMATRGLDVFGFEYPPRVVFEADGSVKVMDLDVFNDLQVFNDADIDGDLIVDGDVTIGGILFSSGATDVIAFLAL